MPTKRPEKLRMNRWRNEMTIEEQIQFEKEQIESKIANINDARALLRLLSVAIANTAQEAVTKANKEPSFDTKLELLFNALQSVLDIVGEKEESVIANLNDYESQLKLIELLQQHIEDAEAVLVEDSEDQV